MCSYASTRFIPEHTMDKLLTVSLPQKQHLGHLKALFSGIVCQYIDVSQDVIVAALFKCVHISQTCKEAVQ